MTLNVHAWGSESGRPLLCIHGVTSWGGRYARFAERFAARRILAVDLRGHGESTWDPPWDLDTHVADVVATLDAASIAKADVVGHSFGGRIALELAGRYPERVDRLALLDPAVWVPPPIALKYAERACAEQAYASAADAVAARLAENPHAVREIAEEEVPRAYAVGEDGLWRARISRAAVVAAYGEMAKPPPLERVTAKTLLVRGRESNVVPEALVDVVLDALPGCEVVTVPGGHLVFWDAFEETVSVVARFLG